MCKEGTSSQTRLSSKRGEWAVITNSMEVRPQYILVISRKKQIKVHVGMTSLYQSHNDKYSGAQI